MRDPGAVGEVIRGLGDLDSCGVESATQQVGHGNEAALQLVDELAPGLGPEHALVDVEDEVLGLEAILLRRGGDDVTLAAKQSVDGVLVGVLCGHRPGAGSAGREEEGRKRG